MSESCYMCANVATSREHVPPACLFPEMHAIGRDLRRNLITVPSCDEHNLNKSGLDEILRAVLCMVYGANAAGRHQFFSKNLRAVTRSKAVFRQVVTDKGSIAGGAARAVQIPRAKFDGSIDYVAKGLYYHTYKCKWLGPVLVHSPAFFDGVLNGQMLVNEETAAVVPELRSLLQPAPVMGENEEVFLYRIARAEDQGGFALAMLFYGAVEVFAFAIAGDSGACT